MIELSFSGIDATITPFSVEVSGDGSVWRNVFTSTAASARTELTRFDIEPAYGRYFRLISLSESDSAPIELAEINLCQPNNISPTAVSLSETVSAESTTSALTTVLALAVLLLAVTIQSRTEGEGHIPEDRS